MPKQTMNESRSIIENSQFAAERAVRSSDAARRTFRCRIYAHSHEGCYSDPQKVEMTK